MALPWKKLAPASQIGIVTLVVAISFALPQVTSYATGYADSDEFLLISQNLSVAHPPGYGLLSLTAYVFNRLIFWGNTAFAGNLLSALFSATSLAVLSMLAWKILTQLKKRPKLSLELLLVLVLFPSTLMLSGVFGIYATILEVTSLTALLFALTLALSLHWHQSKTQSNRILFVAAGVFGLGVSHYQPMIIVTPALLWLLFSRLRKKLPTANRLRLLGITFASFLLSLLLPYISVFIVNTSKPDTSWFFESSISGVINLATRKDYSGYFLDDNIQRSAYFGGAVINKFVRSQIPYWQMLFEQLSVGYVAFALLGLGMLMKKNRDVGIFFALLWLIIGPVFIGFLGTPIPSAQNLSYEMSLGIFQRQLVLSFVVIGALATIAAAVATQKLASKNNKRLAAWLVPLLAGGLLLSHAHKFGFGFETGHKNLIPTYAKLMLASAKADSVIICGSDMACFGLLYASEVEGLRPDVTILAINNVARRYFLEKNPQYYPFSYQENPFFAANLIAWNASKRTTYLTNPSSFYIEYVGLHGDPFFLVPNGLLFEVTTLLPESLTPPSDTFFNLVLATSVPKFDHFMRGFRDYMANIAYFSGVLSAHLDQKQIAQSYLDQALTLKSDYADVTEWLTKLYSPALIASYTLHTANDLDYMERYRQLLEATKLDDAYKQLLKASFLQPENQLVRLELAKLYLQGNFTDLARAEFEHLELFGPLEASISAQAQEINNKLR
jgi:hypothetical protein